MISKRLKLINCNTNILESISKGNEALSKCLNVRVMDKWTEFGNQIFEWSLEQVIKDPDSKKWFIYLPVETLSNTQIGTCGFKGPPDKNGMVEIGYEVAKGFRNRGYATEIVEILVRIAFEDRKVKAILAHTLAEKNASVKVLKKCNFNFINELHNKGEGTFWEWKKEK
jgi:RimJ/RimL family protein N-acetyltransferase